MRKIAIVAGLGLVLLGAAPASAENDVTTVTGTATWSDAQNGYLWNSQCRLVAAAQDPGSPGGNASFTGVIAGTAVAYRPANNQLASVDLHCQVKVNGTIVVAGGNGASNGVDNDAGQVAFTASDAQTIEVCIALPGLSAATTCVNVTRQVTPPEAAGDLVTNTLRAANDVLCPILKSASPVVVGTVFVLEDDGDIVILGNRVYDCPPYGT